MPVGVFKSVREVSSEDSVHVAANLLQENAAKKWKTKAPGEKSAHVILEFEEPQQITGIDIGNEHAAFVEVQVSRSGCQPDDFKELLLSCAFMTSIESKNSSNANRVRCFATDALIATTLSDKWKLVKIICTQPFNKHVQYGISFIKVHVTASTASAAKPATKSLVPDKFKLAPKLNTSLVMGQLKLREESPDSDPDGNALFQRWKASRNEVSTAAAIRDAASPAALRRLSETRPATLKVQVSPAPVASKPAAKTEGKPLDRNREALLFGDDETEEEEKDSKEARRQRLSKHLEADKNRRRLELEELEQQKKAKSKRQSIDKPTIKETPKVVTSESPQQRPQKRLSSTLIDNKEEVVSSPAKKLKSKEEKPIKYVPFNQLLRGVVLVISGIQNPDRADLRAKAVALGAKYKADWEAGCTHLICAFRNTPKYNQVKGKGKIVTRSWIEKCYALKKYLPWRRYALDTAALGQPESDEEIFDESLKPTVDDDNDDAKDVVLVDKMEQSASDPDTEDELERVAQQKKLKQASDENRNNNNIQKKSNDSKNVYEVSTDEEDYLQEMRRK
ncbi:DNA repair protein XRCC1 [Drosophila nasuta]|uniref:DNA repair protein XRCC1 n=1 Tax=Drosophila nasuta TaxID=42062 RepID=UPI00295EDE8A|nr:DNA repair protein XRCC1 [Drosophila nasuta]